MLKKLDRKIFFLFYNFTIKKQWILKTAVLITNLSSKFFTIIYSAAAVWLFYNRDSHLQKFILMPAAVYFVVKLIPNFYNRKRPTAEFSLKNSTAQRRDHSFPSTHTASSMIISLAILDLKLGLGLGVLLITAAVITAFSRIMVGVHYPTDLIGAWLIVFVIYFLANNF